jgi:hypothetical protein
MKRIRKMLPLLFATTLIAGALAVTAGLASAASDCTGSVNKKALCHGQEQVGKKCTWSATETKSLNCARLAYDAYRKAGLKDNYLSASATYNKGIKLDWAVPLKDPKKDAKAGDLLFFNTKGRGVDRVGIYAGSNKVILATGSSSSKKSEKVTLTELTAARIKQLSKKAVRPAVPAKTQPLNAVDSQPLAAVDSDPAEPDTTNSCVAAPEGDAPEGDAPEGDASEGDAPEGTTPDGDAPEGDATTPEGDATTPEDDTAAPQADATDSSGTTTTTTTVTNSGGTTTTTTTTTGPGGGSSSGSDAESPAAEPDADPAGTEADATETEPEASEPEADAAGAEADAAGSDSDAGCAGTDEDATSDDATSESADDCSDTDVVDNKVVIINPSDVSNAPGQIEPAEATAGGTDAPACDRP